MLGVVRAAGMTDSDRAAVARVMADIDAVADWPE
jgi:hypothetical protein